MPKISFPHQKIGGLKVPGNALTFSGSEWTRGTVITVKATCSGNNILKTFIKDDVIVNEKGEWNVVFKRGDDVPRGVLVSLILCAQNNKDQTEHSERSTQFRFTA